VSISLKDLLEQLDVGVSLFVVGDDVFIFNARKGVEVLNVAVGFNSSSFFS
jgi:hypothetical protein